MNHRSRQLVHRVLLAGVVVAVTAAATGTAEAKPLPTPSSSAGAAVVSKAQGGGIGTYVVSTDLSCTLISTSGTSQFFDDDSCGTLLVVDGEAYGPDRLGLGALTPARQTGPTGAGTTADPFVVVTVARAGTTGVTIKQVDSYASGSDVVNTTMTVVGGPKAHDVWLSHAADCYVGGDDVGIGITGGVPGAVPGEVGCRSVASNGLIGSSLVEFIPRTSGSTYNEGGYSENYNLAAAPGELGNSCLCSSAVDNGMALKWHAAGGAGATTVVKMSTRLRTTLPTPTFVALGDSYSSGEGAPSPTTPAWYAGTNVENNKCHRSPAAWAVQVSRDLYAGNPFSFHACSGATTSDLTAPNHSNSLENKPQVSWLSSNTGIVTVTIGGNDARFADVMTYCATRTALMATCRAKWHTQVDAAIATLANVNALDSSLRIQYDQIHQHAPNAQIFVVGYPRFFPDVPPRNCATGVPRFSFGQSDMRWINSEVDAMNAAIQEAVGLTFNAHYVDISHALTDHDLCAAGDDQWINDAQPTNTVLSYHPNNAGQQQIASVVEGAILDTF